MSIGSQKHHNIEYIQIFLQFLIGIFVLSFIRVFFNLKISGKKELIEKLKEYKKNEKGIIFAPNHISEMDVLMVRFGLPFIIPIMPMYYVSMTKDYGGSFFKLLGAYSAYLGVRDYHASLINHIELLENGKAVCIFPEGKMGMETFKPGEAKGGVGFLAEYTHTDIVPVQLKGFRDVNWFKAFTFQRPVLEVSYKSILSIDETLNTLKSDEKYADDVVRYKKIASITMDKIWE